MLNIDGKVCVNTVIDFEMGKLNGVIFSMPIIPFLEFFSLFWSSAQTTQLNLTTVTNLET